MPVLKEGIRVSTIMLNEGWCLTISFPSSTIDMRWPIPGDGYRTIVVIALLV